MSLLWKNATNHTPGDDPEDYGVPYARGADDHLHAYATHRLPDYDLQPHDEVYATQHWVDPEHPAIKSFDPQEAQRGEFKPSLVVMDGLLYINDGHHRILGARKAGHPIRCEIWHNPDFDDES